MRRLLRLILITATFLGGYYFGRMPGSPDIFAYARGTYRSAVRASEKVSARAEQDDSSYAKAALNCAVEAVTDSEQPDSRN
ncbi:MAG TPA: hypothetical protein VFJ30_08685 [Phycisphaerae bacterium]|nr:hypothetical protein [Phycisphaerae bacterium]